MPKRLAYPWTILVVLCSGVVQTWSHVALFLVFLETVTRMWTRKAWTFRKKAYSIAIFALHAKVCVFSLKFSHTTLKQRLGQKGCEKIKKILYKSFTVVFMRLPRQKSLKKRMKLTVKLFYYLKASWKCYVVGIFAFQNTKSIRPAVRHGCSPALLLPINASWFSK